MFKISEDELNRRWQAVRQVMKDRKLDFLIAQNGMSFFSGNVKWFTAILVGDGYPVTVIFPHDDEIPVIMHGPMS